MTFDFNKAMNDGWEQALQHIRDGGEDPEEVIAQAAANIERYQALSPEERAREDAVSLKAWLDWEMTVDDMGRPL